VNLLFIDYRACADSIEAHVAEHRAYLKQHLLAGNYLLAGKLASGTGGIILTREASSAEIDGWIAEDPYTVARVADFRIVPWRPVLQTQHDTLLSALMNIKLEF
jgi:uncharacterized protein YciI